MRLQRIIEDNFPFFIGIPAFIWQALFFYTPLCFVIGMSFRNLSFDYFTPFFTMVYAGVIVRTLVLALSAATICLAIAYPVAYWIAFNGRRFKEVLLFFLFVPFWTNFLLHVYAWMFVLERGGVVNTVLLKIGLISEPLHLLNSVYAVGLIMVYCYLPFMILPIYSSLEKFDKRLFQASLDLGATWWQTMKRVVIPMSWPGIRSGLFLVFVLAFGEFAIPELVGGDKFVFVGNVVTYYTLSANTASLGSAFTLLSSALLIAFLLVVHGVGCKIMKRS